MISFRSLKTTVAFCILIFVASTGTGAQTCQPAPIGLISWWEAEDNALDSRSRLTGTLGVTGFSNGFVGRAFSSFSSDGVQVADTPALNQQQFTVEAWVTASTFVCGNPTPDSCSQFIAAKSGSTGVTGFEIGTRQAGTIRFTLDFADVGSAGDLTGSTSIFDGSFHHVAVTYDGATMKIYIDGVLDAQKSVATTITYPANQPFYLGSRGFPGNSTIPFNGKIDEASFYGRALSAAEIAAIHAAGSSGKCKPTATVAPPNAVGWWPGDGVADEITGNGVDGVSFNGAGFSSGRVGQAFSFDGLDDFYDIGQLTQLDNSTSVSASAWVRRTNVVDSAGAIVGKWDSFPSANNSFVLWLGGDGVSSNVGAFAIQFDDDSFGVVSDTTEIPANVWVHLAATWRSSDGALAFYKDGVQVASTTAGVGRTMKTHGAFTGKIGEWGSIRGPNFKFRGQIDEVTLYNRSLTQTEIRSEFTAGIAGKLKQTVTPTGFADRRSLAPQAVEVRVGDATINFNSVTLAGVTQQIPLDPAQLPALPAGTHTGLIYDISTSAEFTGNPSVCFDLPFVSSVPFAGLRVMHFASGVWTDVTDLAGSSYPELCTLPLTSFSPFAIVQTAPTAANAMVGGRVFDVRGHVIRGAVVSIADADGTVRSTKTNSFGSYVFRDVAVGQSYVFSVRAKGQNFQPRLITITEDVANLDHFAIPKN